MPRQKKQYNPAQPSLFELSLKTAPCVPAIRQAVREWVAAGYEALGPVAAQSSLLVLADQLIFPPAHRLHQDQAGNRTV